MVCTQNCEFRCRVCEHVFNKSKYIFKLRLLQNCENFNINAHDKYDINEFFSDNEEDLIEKNSNKNLNIANKLSINCEQICALELKKSFIIII